jgi:hypothetical protein
MSPHCLRDTTQYWFNLASMNSRDSVNKRIEFRYPSVSASGRSLPIVLDGWDAGESRVG